MKTQADSASASAVDFQIKIWYFPRTISPGHLLSWHAPLGGCSAKRRHQSPEWTI